MIQLCLLMIILSLIILIFFGFCKQGYTAILSEQENSFRAADPVIDNIPIFIIHQKKNTRRRERLLQDFKRTLPNKTYTFVEPIPVHYLRKNLRSLVNTGILSEEGYADIQNFDTKSIRGALSLPSLSLYMTNLQLFRDNLSIKTPILILEDDAIFRPHFRYYVAHLLKNLPPDWDLMYLSCHHECKTHTRIEKIDTRIHGMGAVLYHPRVLTMLINTLPPITLQIDHDIPDKLIVTGKINAYVACNDECYPLVYNDNLNGSSTGN